MDFENFEKTHVFIVVTALLGFFGLFYLVLSQKKGNVSTSPGEDKSPALKKEENASQISTIDGKVISPAQFKSFTVLQISKISHNTKLIRFEIPHGKSLDLPIGRHVSVQATIDGLKVTRAYTPTSRTDQKGYFDLLIKRYETGKMSVYLHSLKVGKSIDIRGPVGRFKYAKNMYKSIGLLAGGTGLTPCLQVIRCVLEGPEGKGDDTNFILFFQNRTEEDILMRDQLDDLQQQFPNRLRIVYYLSNPSSSQWGVANPLSSRNERRGYVSQCDIDNEMNPEACQLVCMCGPSGFNDFVKSLLLKSNHTDESIYIW